MIQKVAFYAAKINEYGDLEECCYSGDKPDIILIGAIEKCETHSGFIGRVITNWCDKLPTDSLVFRGRSFYDQGGIAEDEDGNDIWQQVLKFYPDLQIEIEALYENLVIDCDEEHYNISQEIEDEIRMFCLYEGNHIDLSMVKKGNGEDLLVEIFI
jgi:hypothetical protein